MSALLQNLRLSLIVFLIMLLLAEGFLRLFPKPSVETWSTDLFCPTTEIGRRMKSNVSGKQLLWKLSDIEVASNREGYRDEQWEHKTEDRRVMILGDSFGFGWGVPYEQTVGFLLDQVNDLAAYNLSMPGDGIEIYVKRYFFHKDRIKPEWAVLLLYANDFFMSGKEPDVEVHRNQINKLERQGKCVSYPLTFRGWLNQSYLFALINKYRVTAGLSFFRENRRKKLFKIAFSPDVKYQKDNGKRLAFSFDYLNDFIKVLKEDGVKVLMVHIPADYVMNPDDLALYHEVFGEVGKNMDLEVIPKKLIQISQENAVTLIDLRKPFRQERKDVYLEHDYHLNGDGHAIMAREIRRVLQNNK